MSSGRSQKPESILNAGGGVWDVDPLLRPSGVDGASERGGSSAVSELFLAVGTGALRQTDDPVDEVGERGGVGGRGCWVGRGTVAVLVKMQ